MTNKIKIKVKTYNKQFFINKMMINNISIENLKDFENMFSCYIDEKDLKKIEKLYRVEVLYNRKQNMFSWLKNNVWNIGAKFVSIILFLVISNLIVGISISGGSEEIQTKLINYLDENNIKRLVFKKNYQDINNIKSEILNKYQDNIEWLEIEQQGMNYQIKIQERIKEEKEEKGKFCQVVAISNGFVKKIIASQGVSLVKNNDYVKEGDLLINGELNTDSEIKGKVCAEGKIYAEKWYEAKMSVPTTYKVKKFTNKKKYNFKIENGNHDYTILRSRFTYYDDSDKQIISLFGIKLYLVKEEEYILEEVLYTQEELNKQIDNLIEEKINISLDEGEVILYKNVLNKSEFNSKIDIDIFVSVQKIISKVIKIE